MVNRTIITAQEDDQERVVVTDEATGIQAKGSNRPIALRTLGQKLEMELHTANG